MVNKRGSVLMISLWILTILVVFALGLGQRAIMNMRMAKYQRDSLKASSLAGAGIKRAILEIKKDATPGYDGFYENWCTGKDASGNTIFENISISNDSDGKFSVHVTDEESKININSASKELLTELFASLKIQDADSLAELVRDWIDADTVTTTGQEDKIFKNAPLKANEELVLILDYFYDRAGTPAEARKNAQETFAKVKERISVYGDNPNINTASEENLVIMLK